MEISIIIATYNSGSTLRQCLESIVHQLDEDSELIIIDGGSQDNTTAIINQYREFISYTISERDSGVYEAWNKGIMKAKGEWIAFIGSDDMMIEGTMSLYKDFLSNESVPVDFIMCKNLYVSKNGIVLKETGEPWDWFKFSHRKLSFAHPGMLHNRRCFQEKGLFDTNFKICGDSEFLLRFGPQIKVDFIDKCVVEMSEGGISDSFRAVREGYLARKKNNSLGAFENVLCYFRLSIFYYLGRIKRFLLKNGGK